jgi:NAD(P)-dependent dehydrogenase (short-subunit alcohol dehydrogenase family)
MSTTSHTDVPAADPAAHLADTEARSPDTHARQAEAEARRADLEARRELVHQSLKGRVALVTGGNRGIGAAICRRLGAAGAAVAAGYGQSREKAEAFAHELEEGGTSVSIHQGNVGSADDCRRVMSEVVEQHGSIDILVNNAGITIDKPVLKMSDEDWYKVLAVNLSGAFFMSQAALPHMIEGGGGRIVNISSIIGQQGNIGQANYAASKSGLFGLTMTLAREAAKAMVKAHKQGPDCRGVTVNTVAPGFVKTEMLDSVPEKVLDDIVAKIPAGRLGEPDEIARTVHFLCEDASSYITGQVWGVNGGMEMAGA